VVSVDVLHTSLICSTRVSEAKRHCHVIEHAERCDEGSRELVRLVHLYLVVPRSRIYDLINPWQRKRNFRTCFIQTSEIYTHSPLPILFLN
jgi:hypothetical protein